MDLTFTTNVLASQITWCVSEENLGSDLYMIRMNVYHNRVTRESEEILNEKKWVDSMNEILSMENLTNMRKLEGKI